MATIAVCPGCQTQLGVPPEAPTGAQLECPLCQKRFAASPDCVRILAMANVAPVIAAAPAAATVAPLTLPPDALITAEPTAVAPPAEVEVDFDVGALSATTPIASQPTASWDAELPDDQPSAPKPTLAANQPEPRRLAGDWSTASNGLAPASAAPPLPLPAAPAAAQTADERDDVSRDDVEHAEFEHDDLESEDDAVHAMDFDGMAPASSPARASADASPDFDMRPAPRPRRRRASPVGTLVGIVGGGGIGLLLAGYALLWLTDPPLDLFHMAEWAPTAVLPNTLQHPSAASQWADDEATAESAAVASQNAGLASEPQSLDDAAAPTDATEETVADIQSDPAVTPASASEPAAAEPSEPPFAPPAPAMPLDAPSKWPSTPIVGDLVAPHYASLVDFTASIEKVDAAGRRFLASDLSNVQTRRDMGQAYVQLCEVAERYTLTDPADYGSDLFTKQALAKAVLRRVAGNTKRRQDLNVVAARWWEHAKRTNNGLVLVGRVTNHTPRGQWTEHMLEIAVGQEIVEVPVLMDRILFSTGSEAAVVGAIVANPHEQIRGYEGTAPQVVVAGAAFDPALYANESTGEDKVIDSLKL